MKNINPTKTNVWKDLVRHYKKIKNIHIRDLFKNDMNRYKNFSIIFKKQILVDFSKNRITRKTLNKLLNLAKKIQLKKAINCMFSGKKINKTENRSVLHIALRNQKNKPIKINGINIMKNINFILKKMEKFSKLVISGSWKGYTGRSIRDIVNIGIGGSNIGPYMATEALKDYKNHLNLYFISNLDENYIIKILKKLKPETTLFLITSKTFKTQETIDNAKIVKRWFLKKAKKIKSLEKHFIAISSNKKEAYKFGIKKKNIFYFWNWVCGRYSLWSSVGLSIILSIGFKNFQNLLRGAHDMDEHFLHTNFDQNIPVILALINIWYNNFFSAETEAILTYNHYLHGLISYFQQINMESNGKNIDRNGNFISYNTSPIIWGGIGIDAQHSFYQLLHQGTRLIPCDFIAVVNSKRLIASYHDKLMANFFAQTKALAFGENSIKKNEKKKLNKLSSIQKHQLFFGNNPTNSILIKKITPYTLGSLIAMYEHKIFVQGVVLNIFSFDQWGVNLGKKISKKILSELKNNSKIYTHDSSTNNLINYFKYWRKNKEKYINYF